MKLAMIALGKMSANMVRKPVKHKQTARAYNTNVQSAQNLSKQSKDNIPVDSLGAAVAALSRPRVL